MRRGLRQCDPILLFLFNTAVEALNCVISKGCEKGLVSGLHVGVDNVRLTRFQYADDIILFIPHADKTMLNYRRIIECFALITGLQINFSKSSSVTWSTNTKCVDKMSREVNCVVLKLPMKYLGCLLVVVLKG